MPKPITQLSPASRPSYTMTRLNAVKHGATSQTPILPWEDHAEFDALHANLVREYEPLGQTETYCVDRLAAAMWRIYRLQRAEKAVHMQALERVLARAEGPDATAVGKETARAVLASEAETAQELNELEEAEASIAKALQYLNEVAPDSWERAKCAVVPQIQREWSEYQPQNLAELAVRYLPEQERFRHFLLNRKIPFYKERRFFLENRERIRDQAFDEAADDPALERLDRHEVHLHRRLEKHLTILLTLQERRGKVFGDSVLQNRRRGKVFGESVSQKIQKALPDVTGEPEQLSGTDES